MGDKINDLVTAINEEGISDILGSDEFKKAVIDLMRSVSSEQTGMLIGSIIAGVAPRITGVILSYKQKRLERNMIRLFEGLRNRVLDLENNYLSLNEEMQQKYRSLFVEMLLDNTVDECEEKKIKWNTNGYINLMTNESNYNLIKYFFDTLCELNVLDIDVLKIYEYDSGVNYQMIEEQYNIDSERLKLIKDKLVRMGLLYRQNDLQRDTNIDAITEYLLKCDDEAKKTRPQMVKISKSVKKVSRIQSYKISGLGYNFLQQIK